MNLGRPGITGQGAGAWLAGAGCAFFALAALLMDLTPPTGRDSLIHHLAVPRLWLDQGLFSEIKWLVFSYYPQNLETLYLAPLAAGFGQGAKLIHCAFGLLTALLVYLALRPSRGRAWALGGACLFLSIPTVFRLMGTAYVDLGLVFFLTAGWFFLARAFETGRATPYFLSAIFLGLGLGTKYSALPALVVLPPAALAVAWRSRASVRAALVWAGLYGALALAVFSPWLTRDYLLTGNPLYPLFGSLFGGPDATNGAGLDIFTRRMGLYGESFFQVLASPVRVFFLGQDNSARYFDGVIGPFILLFSLPALACGRERKWLFISGGAWLFILFAFFTSSFRVRYIAPVFPALCVLSVVGLGQLKTWLGRFAGARLSGFLAACALALAITWGGIHAGGLVATASPWAYLAGRESRAQYLSRRLPSYPAIAYLNAHARPGERVLLLFAGDQGYYLEPDYFFNAYYSGEAVRPLFMAASSAEEIRMGLKAMGVTAILTQDRLLNRFLADNFGPEKLRVIGDFAKTYLEREFGANGFFIYRLR